MTPQETISACATLDELCDALNDLEDSRDVNMTSLPTFGGEGPADTAGIWSWDATRTIVQGEQDYAIIDRDDV